MSDFFPFDGDEEEGSSPEFQGSFPISEDGEWFADVYGQGDGDNVAFSFHDIFSGLDIDASQEFMLDMISVHGLDGYDSASDDARGPYDHDEVIQFLNETGWWGIADVYYDEDSGEYYVDINYEG